MKKVISILLGIILLAYLGISFAKGGYVRSYYNKTITSLQPVESSPVQTQSNYYVSSSTTVPATESGSVSLSWKAPSLNADGSILNDLAGYKIYYGVSSMQYTRSVDVGLLTASAISNLYPANWCFSVIAYDASGNESKYSNEVCKKI